MTETLQGVSSEMDAAGPPLDEPRLGLVALDEHELGRQTWPDPEPVSTVASAEELDIARELVRSARVRGVALTGPEGMLKALTKTARR